MSERSSTLAAGVDPAQESTRKEETRGVRLEGLDLICAAGGEA